MGFLCGKHEQANSMVSSWFRNPQTHITLIVCLDILDILIQNYMNND